MSAATLQSLVDDGLPEEPSPSSSSMDFSSDDDESEAGRGDEKAEEEVMKLVEAAEAPGTALARLFEEEVVPPTSIADAGDPEF